MNVIFNKKYLGHDLIDINRPEYSNDYKCIKCNIELYHSYDGFRFMKNNNVLSIEICELTCDECIIKNILE